MGGDIKEQWFSLIVEQLDAFCNRVDEKIAKEQQQLKECKKKTELETKLAHEMKLNLELTERLAELSRRGGELDRVCATLSTLSITDSDRHRLENARETHELAKELTSIRLDFSAPPHIAKGYIKNEARKLLQPFEIDMSAGGDSEALWSLLHMTSTPGWPQLGDKENRPVNY
ncbi:uncharacterized protein LOC113514853 [Galleria mellonella]|uniref:Uncharacterized protein LOC113514853 n=1 Tax=Galleria mellonella TaxID=7137 RepID=A0A6J1WJM3_GALME|nr:uncharacterized protein LOC113514853 [Galleria mellonella]